MVATGTTNRPYSQPTRAAPSHGAVPANLNLPFTGTQPRMVATGTTNRPYSQPTRAAPSHGAVPAILPLKLNMAQPRSGDGKVAPGLQPGVRTTKTASPGQGVGAIARCDLGQPKRSSRRPSPSFSGRHNEYFRVEGLTRRAARRHDPTPGPASAGAGSGTVRTRRAPQGPSKPRDPPRPRASQLPHNGRLFPG